MKLAVFYVPKSLYNSRGKLQVSFQIKLSVTILHVWFADGLTPGLRYCKIFWIDGRSSLQDRGGFYSTVNSDNAPILEEVDLRSMGGR